MQPIIKVGIIGFGGAGRVFHAPIITCVEGLELATIYTTNESTKTYINQHYKQTVVTDDVQTIFDDQTIDLVVIATPNSYHYEYAKKALLSDKHVVVEKPFTVTVEEADSLIDLSKKTNKVLTVFQNRRFDSDFITLKKVIQSDVLGEIVEFESHFDRFRNYLKLNWREKDVLGAGVLYDLGPHLVDQALDIFGLPNYVFADVRKQRSVSEVDDYFEIILYYDNVKVTLKAGMLVREALPKYILSGESGSYMKYGMDVQEAALKQGYTPLTMTDWGVEPEAIYGTVHTEIKGITVKGRVTSEPGDYRMFYQDVYRAIVEGGAPIVKPEEARNTMKIIMLALESSKQKSALPYN